MGEIILAVLITVSIIQTFRNRSTVLLDIYISGYTTTCALAYLSKGEIPTGAIYAGAALSMFISAYFESRVRSGR